MVKLKYYYTLFKANPKYFIKNLLSINSFYVIQAFFRSIFWTKKAKEVIVEFKKSKCGDCYKQGACIECGCEIHSMFLSDKPCPINKF
jgi:hypothetical protein